MVLVVVAFVLLRRRSVKRIDRRELLGEEVLENADDAVAPDHRSEAQIFWEAQSVPAPPPPEFPSHFPFREYRGAFAAIDWSLYSDAIHVYAIHCASPGDAAPLLRLIFRIAKKYGLYICGIAAPYDATTGEFIEDRSAKNSLKARYLQLGAILGPNHLWWNPANLPHKPGETRF